MSREKEKRKEKREVREREREKPWLAREFWVVHILLSECSSVDGRGEIEKQVRVCDFNPSSASTLSMTWFSHNIWL